MADSVLEQIAALKDHDWAIREEAAVALGEARDSRAVVPLLAMLRDPDRAVRDAAIAALTAIGEPAVMSLGASLRDGDLTLQEGATSILAKIGDHRVFDDLVNVLGSADWIVRSHAAQALGRIGDPRGVDSLIPLLQDKVKAVREDAARALVTLGEVALPRLRASLSHEDWLVRLHAVEALGKMRVSAVVEDLLSVLFNDRDTAVRVDAARALGEIGDARAVEFLLNAMKDRDIRPKAIEALGRIGDRRAVPTLIQVVTGTSPSANDRLMQGCGDRYEEEIMSLDAAVRALASIRDAAALPTLIGALQNTLVREEAAQALVAFGPPAIPLLLDVLRKEEDDNILYHVKESLHALGWRPNRIKSGQGSGVRGQGKQGKALR